MSSDAVSLWRLPLVKARTGKSRTAIYEGMRAGTFPLAVGIGARSIAWRSDQVMAFIESCVPKTTAIGKAAAEVV